MSDIRKVTVKAKAKGDQVNRTGKIQRVITPDVEVVDYSREKKTFGGLANMTADKFVKLTDTKKWVNLHKNDKEVD